MKRAKLAFTLLLTGSALAGCAEGPARFNANGDTIGVGPGANVRTDIAPQYSTATGYCSKPQEVRYRVRDTAGTIVSDYVHTATAVYTSVPCNEVPRPLGFCFREMANGTPAWDNRGLHNGQFLDTGMTVIGVPCTGADPYNYAQYATSPYGRPVYINGQYVRGDQQNMYPTQQRVPPRMAPLPRHPR